MDVSEGNMKQYRHKRILEIIGEKEIETQEELAKNLQNEGFSVTQATVSRDIRELRLMKVPNGQGKQKYAAAFEHAANMGEKYSNVLREGYASMDVAQNILVLKTAAGMAMAVAAALDSMHFTEIVGSIAGDDTILMVAHSERNANALKEKILNML